MYSRIVLAYDGSTEGRLALREGALLARQCGASVFLLSVAPETPGMLIAEGAQAGVIAQEGDAYGAILEEGLERLRALGFEPQGKVLTGEPSQTIAAYAREVNADLVVVGYRRRNALARWWAGSTSARLSDHVHCSVLIGRNVISDTTFQAALDKPA